MMPRTFAAVLLAASVLPSCAGSRPQGIFRVPANPDYAHVKDSLAQLVAERGKQPVNHFCVVGYRTPGSEPTVWVHWDEENRLILWEPYTKDAGPDRKNDLLNSRRNLNLATDVVASEAELQGSTYRVTKAWADKTLADCRSAGSKYSIPKKGK